MSTAILRPAVLSRRIASAELLKSVVSRWEATHADRSDSTHSTSRYDECVGAGRRAVGLAFTPSAVAWTLSRYGVERTTVGRLYAYCQNSNTDRTCAPVASGVGPSAIMSRHLQTDASPVKRSPSTRTDTGRARLSSRTDGRRRVSGRRLAVLVKVSVSEVSPVEPPVVPDEPRPGRGVRRDRPTAVEAVK